MVIYVFQRTPKFYLEYKQNQNILTDITFLLHKNNLSHCLKSQSFSRDFVSCDCPYQVADLIQQIVDLCTIGQSNVGLAQQSADLLPDLGLGHSHHHHEGRDIIQHVGQQLILIVFQTLPLQISKGNIPAKSWQKIVQAIHVFHTILLH